MKPLLIIWGLLFVLSCNKETPKQNEKKPKNKITFGIKKK